MLDFTDGVQKTVLITLPLFHTTGQTVQMNTNLYGGNRIVLLPRFEPKATLDAMVEGKGQFLDRRADDVLGAAQICRGDRLRHQPDRRKYEGLHAPAVLRCRSR